MGRPKVSRWALTDRSMSRRTAATRSVGSGPTGPSKPWPARVSEPSPVMAGRRRGQSEWPHRVGDWPGWFAFLRDANNNRIRRVGPRWSDHDCRGRRQQGYCRGNPGNTANSISPTSLAVGPDGSVYFSSGVSPAIRAVRKSYASAPMGSSPPSRGAPHRQAPTHPKGMEMGTGRRSESRRSRGNRRRAGRISLYLRDLQRPSSPCRSRRHRHDRSRKPLWAGWRRDPCNRGGEPGLCSRDCR